MAGTVIETARLVSFDQFDSKILDKNGHHALHVISFKSRDITVSSSIWISFRVIQQCYILEMYTSVSFKAKTDHTSATFPFAKLSQPPTSSDGPPGLLFSNATNLKIALISKSAFQPDNIPLAVSAFRPDGQVPSFSISSISMVDSVASARSSS